MATKKVAKEKVAKKNPAKKKPAKKKPATKKVAKKKPAKKVTKKKPAKKKPAKKKPAKKKPAKATASKGSDDPIMARARALTKRRKGFEEKRMFGGVAFMVNGHMAFGGGSKHLAGRLMVRVGPDAYEDALAQPHASVMDFTGRVMKGFVVVDAAGIQTDDELKAWIERGVAFARSLPPK